MSTLHIEDKAARRQFVPKDFEVTSWDALRPYYESLLNDLPGSAAALEAWLAKRNELDAIVAETYAWRYIRMTCDTNSEAKSQAYSQFVQEIMPPYAKLDDQLNRHLADNPFFEQLPDDPYLTFKRGLKQQIALFREENIPLGTEAKTVAQQFGAIIGAMTIEHEGKTLTMQQAGKLLEKHDRQLRQEVWENVQNRRLQDKDKLQEVFDKLLGLRTRIAKNAGYESFTRYQFDALGRFDYQPEDTLVFHDSVERTVKPVFEQLMAERREKLGLDQLRPWDLEVDIFGKDPLEPFQEASQLLDRSISILAQLKPEMGEMIRLMDNMGYLDLESRVGKAPGGYNYPLMETGVPFIFMNAAGSQSDVITMLHESGHAVHAFLTRDLPLNDLKNPPAEVAELASMSMELLSLDFYREFYPDDESLLRAQKNQLMRVIMIFPWIATVDAFQQWLYDHPEHSQAERNAQWVALYRRFHGDSIDWRGHEEWLENMWVKQMHIYEVPFYYIEYAIAQLGAIAVWRNYKQHPERGLTPYLEALKMGYTAPIPAIYERAGIRFDFSADYMQQSMDFCLEAYQALEK